MEKGLNLFRPCSDLRRKDSSKPHDKLQGSEENEKESLFRWHTSEILRPAASMSRTISFCEDLSKLREVRKLTSCHDCKYRIREEMSQPILGTFLGLFLAMPLKSLARVAFKVFPGEKR